MQSLRASVKVDHDAIHLVVVHASGRPACRVDNGKDLDLFVVYWDRALGGS